MPFQVAVANYPYSNEGAMTTQSAYLRDAWRFGERATINAGVRFERGTHGAVGVMES